TVSATSNSGLAVSLSSPTTKSVCSITNATVSLVSVGTCSIVAVVNGSSGTYADAPSVTRSFNVTKIQQSIVFGAIADHTLSSGPFMVDALASSGLPISFDSGSPGVCAISGKTVTPVMIGTCAIIASQAGNSSYAPAASVTQTFQVTASLLP